MWWLSTVLGVLASLAILLLVAFGICVAVAPWLPDVPDPPYRMDDEQC